MKGLMNPPAVYLYRQAVDFRKSINGLAAIIESETSLALSSGALFLFTNRQRDKVKCLYWDETGFALWYKRLEEAKFSWPSKETQDIFSVTPEALSRLLSGFSIQGHKKVTIESMTFN